MCDGMWTKWPAFGSTTPDRSGVRSVSARSSDGFATFLLWIVWKGEEAAVGNWTNGECQTPVEHWIFRIMSKSFFE
jgi:hypothetical protein